MRPPLGEGTLGSRHHVSARQAFPQSICDVKRLLVAERDRLGRSLGGHPVDRFSEDLTESARNGRAYGVADLSEAVPLCGGKPEPIWETMKSSGFANGNDPIVVRMDRPRSTVRASIGGAPGAQSRTEAIGVKPLKAADRINASLGYGGEACDHIVGVGRPQGCR
jgi:hypothetical protein